MTKSGEIVQFRLAFHQGLNNNLAMSRLLYWSIKHDTLTIFI